MKVTIVLNGGLKLCCASYHPGVCTDPPSQLHVFKGCGHPVC